MMETAIEVRDLKKSYGDLEALRGINFTINRGEIFALLGPNGAGKTTIMEILEGYIQRTSGHVSVLGYDPESSPEDLRSRVGIVLQETGVDLYLKVGEIIKQFSGFYQNPKPINEILDVTGLREQSDIRIRRLSGGQRRRLDVALGIVGDPELLFLDEPTTGLDPYARRNTWNMIASLRELGKTILLTTHYMDEAEVLADKIALLNAGIIEAEGTLEELRTYKKATTIKFELDDAINRMPVEISKLANVIGNEVKLETTTPMSSLAILASWALNEEIELRGLSVQQQSLDEIFIELVEGRGTLGKVRLE
ncbi:MAG: ABC transporter ATP-binding protein [SAR202 cluster bacterium]|nr:ABC transporter ATP-binding protein [SAR202 cluster bacterium]